MDKDELAKARKIIGQMAVFDQIATDYRQRKETLEITGRDVGMSAAVRQLIRNDMRNYG